MSLFKRQFKRDDFGFSGAAGALALFIAAIIDGHVNVWATAALGVMAVVIFIFAWSSRITQTNVKNLDIKGKHVYLKNHLIATLPTYTDTDPKEFTNFGRAVLALCTQAEMIMNERGLALKDVKLQYDTVESEQTVHQVLLKIIVGADESEVYPLVHNYDTTNEKYHDAIFVDENGQQIH